MASLFILLPMPFAYFQIERSVERDRVRRHEEADEMAQMVQCHFVVPMTGLRIIYCINFCSDISHQHEWRRMEKWKCLREEICLRSDTETLQDDQKFMMGMTKRSAIKFRAIMQLKKVKKSDDP